MTERNLAQIVIDDIDEEVRRAACYVVSSGYFDAHLGLDEFSFKTIGIALKIQEVLDSASVHHVVLGNDLGMDCSETVCTLEGAATVSAGTIEQLSSCFTGSSFELVRERTLRNRCVRQLKKYMREHSIEPRFSHDNGKILFSSALYPEVLAATYSTEDEGRPPVPKCTLLMREFYSLLSKKACNKNESVCLIDFNRVADRDKVLRGVECFMATGNVENISIALVFFEPVTERVVVEVFRN